MGGENIPVPDEEVAAAVAVGASVIEHWSIVSGIAVVWSGLVWSGLADGVVISSC